LDIRLCKRYDAKQIEEQVGTMSEEQQGKGGGAWRLKRTAQCKKCP